LHDLQCPCSGEFLNNLPKTETGKVLKHELRRKYWAAPKSAVSQPRKQLRTREGHGSSRAVADALKAGFSRGGNRRRGPG
jgi:hypothetical protein